MGDPPPDRPSTESGTATAEAPPSGPEAHGEGSATVAGQETAAGPGAEPGERGPAGGEHAATGSTDQATASEPPAETGARPPAEPGETGPARAESPEAQAAQPERGEPKRFGSNAEAAEYGRQTWAEAQNALTPQERQALWAYSGEKTQPGEPGPPDYKEINGYLRGRSGGLPEISDSVQRIDHALENGAARDPVTVTRETGYGAFDRPVEELVGTVQEDPGYLSTALGPDPTFDPGKPVVLHLEVPEATPSMYMDGVSQFGAERELLLGRGLQYQVDDVGMVDGRWHVHGRILRR
jgi:hypothetical protein